MLMYSALPLENLRLLTVPWAYTGRTLLSVPLGSESARKLYGTDHLLTKEKAKGVVQTLDNPFG